MKKLLILTAAIGFAFSVNAQQVQTREKTHVSTQKIDVQLAKPATILNNAAMRKAVQKSTNAPTYTSLGTLSSGSFTTSEVGVPPTLASRTLTLFPDSLPKKYQIYPDALDSSFSIKCFPATGFVFDPYSISFDQFGEQGLFSQVDTFYGYKVETIGLWSSYEMANYNASSPDTLRLYLNSYPVYVPDAPRTDDFITLQFTSSKRQAFGTAIKWDNPIPQKGSAVTPKAEPLVINYILSPADSVKPEPGYITARSIEVGIGDDGFEVEPGYVMSVVAKFIPGYDYQLGDTLSFTAFSMTTGEYQYDTIKKNQFEVRGLNFGGTREDPVTDPTGFWDRNGYNSFIAEDQYIRYKDTAHEKYYTVNNIPFYSPGYNIGIAFEFDIYVSDQYFVIEDTTSITDRSELISAIYPNPATSQLTIDLKEEGQANVTIYNVLGQALIQENVSEMSNTINVANLSQGMYTVKVTQNGKVSTVKFSKQ